MMTLKESTITGDTRQEAETAPRDLFEAANCNLSSFHQSIAVAEERFRIAAKEMNWTAIRQELDRVETDPAIVPSLRTALIHLHEQVSLVDIRERIIALLTDHCRENPEVQSFLAKALKEAVVTGEALTAIRGLRESGNSPEAVHALEAAREGVPGTVRVRSADDALTRVLKRLQAA